MRLCPTRTLAVMCALGCALGGMTHVTQADQADKPKTTGPQKTELRAPEAKVPLDLASGIPLVEVMINGAGPFKMAIDTGATETTLDDNVVKTLGLQAPKPADSAKKGGDKPPTVPTVRLISITLGDAVFFDLPAKIVEYDKKASNDRLYDGTLGLDLFSDFLLTLDYPGEHVVINRGDLPAPDGKEVLDYDKTHGPVSIPMALDDDTKTDAAIASAYTGGFAFGAFLQGSITMAPKTFSDHSDLPPTDGKERPDPQMMGTVSIGSHKLFQAPVRFLAADSGSAPRLGHRVLQHFTLTLDQKNHRVRFRRQDADTVTFGVAQPKYGVIFYRYGRYLKVKQVVADSPAGRSPLKVGNKIEWVDGRKPNDFGPGELEAFIDKAEAITFSVKHGQHILHVTLRTWD